ncbi:hypothetical protein SK128_018342, partial [Halocaridina rubra]
IAAPQISVHESNADHQEEESVIFDMINSIMTPKGRGNEKRETISLVQSSKSMFVDRLLQKNFAGHIKRLEENMKSLENKSKTAITQSFENVESYSSNNGAVTYATKTSSMKLVARDKETRQQQGMQQKLQTVTDDNAGCEEMDADNRQRKIKPEAIQKMKHYYDE